MTDFAHNEKKMQLWAKMVSEIAENLKCRFKNSSKI